ncbi:MAG: glutamyl-tRNA reductase, partial [Crenarchaeota archaeon]|nr:glutamyl-tRNA reductase [Thermoproteota archaeon]
MIGVLGISHKTAPLEIREQFSFQNHQIQSFAEELQKQANFSDIVVLSTCNRTEIYFSQSIHDGVTASILLYNCVMAYKKIDFVAEKYFYTYADEAAVSHLFGVCAGIDSLVIGEDQIIGQVKQAYVHCTELALTDAVL